jgi:catalase
MNGYSSHTLKLVDASGNFKYVKWHFKTDQGIKTLTGPQAAQLASADPDYATRDLFNRIARGAFPSWTVYIQVMDPKDALHYRWNPFDVTKVWPHKDYPLHPVGRMTLNRNPDNYFAEVEQSAFSPGHFVPGIEPSEDRMLQGRLFSYPDTHRHRLGTNYAQIPINTPYATRVANHQRDGAMAVNGNGGALPNYEPNSFAGPKQTNRPTYVADRVSGYIGRHTYTLVDDDFVQAGNLWRLQSPDSKTRLVDNIVGHLKNAKKEIQDRQVKWFKKADPEYGRRVETGLAAATAKH